ncbi:MAG: 3-dehydroquinate synthase [Alphaproteobacteria bacterium]|nr:3-dehydroquinate synthase [Alphaproteobacteria bacterium]
MTAAPRTAPHAPSARLPSDVQPAQGRAAVRVDLGARSYDILIGDHLLREVGSALAARSTARRAIVVSDQTIAARYIETVAGSLAGAGFRTDRIILPPGESAKSFAGIQRVCEEALTLGIDRGSCLVALGGGVIGDLTGFAASVLLRGIAFVQLPTTLLAQVDSSVGGKTAIDTPQGKNLVGAFHQPALVLADVGVLASLPPRELRAGYAEIVKYGLIDDPAFFAWCESNAAALLAGDVAALTEAVRASCQAKARVVSADERETGQRALLNLGHTFAHALEAEAGFGDAIKHGEAVAIGMALAFALSSQLGLCPQGDAARVRSHLATAGLPTSPSFLARALGRRLDPDRLMEHIGRDKKVRDGRATFILARGIGHAFVATDVAAERARAFLAANLDGPDIA